MESKEINILVIVEGPLFITAFNNLTEKLKEKHPNIHLYSISPKEKYGEELNKLKHIKFDILTGRPLFVKLTTDVLNTFPSIKWMHSPPAGIEKLVPIESLWNNDNILLSNSRGNIVNV